MAASYETALDDFRKGKHPRTTVALPSFLTIFIPLLTPAFLLEKEPQDDGRERHLGQRSDGSPSFQFCRVGMGADD